MAGISGLSAGIILAGRYQLSRRLWHRSIGELWLASDTVRRRRVWIQISETGGLENAVAALQRVQHPAIAPVREAGQKRIAHEDRVVTDHDSHAHKLIHKSDSYIEFAVYDQDKGSSLTARLMKGALTSAEIATVALSVAEVFEQVHGAGLMHGWLHTDSVWLGAKGSVFVDLALGLAYEGTPDALHAEAATGFVAAERLEGGALTESADVYALSWLLYVCVFGWQIVREDFEEARRLAVAAGHGGHVHGDGMSVAEGEETVEIHVDVKKISVATLLIYRREIAVRRIVEFFGAESELGLLFTACLAGEAGPRPSMTEIVTVLRGRQEEIAALPTPPAVAAALAAAALLAAEAVADDLGAAVEDADTGAWTPAVSPTAGSGRGRTAVAAVGGALAGAAIEGLISREDCESAKTDAVAAALAEAEARYSVQTEEAIALATTAAVAAALAEAEATHAEVNRELVATASAAAVAEALLLAEERHSAERERAVTQALAEQESRANELGEAAIAAAVAAALAEIEAAQAQQNEEAIATASAIAVEAALLEARSQHSAELESVRTAAVLEITERHTAEMTALRSSHGADQDAAIAAAVALAVAELEERHRAELAELHARHEAEQAEAITAASAAAVTLALAEAAEAHHAELAALREQHQTELLQAQESVRTEMRSAGQEHSGAGEAALAAAGAAAVTLALAEAGERHQAELAAAHAEAAQAAEGHQAALSAAQTQAAQAAEAHQAALAAAQAEAAAAVERHQAETAAAAERHRAEMAAAQAEAEKKSAAAPAALAAASAAAVTAALAEAEQRHAAELAAARAEAARAAAAQNAATQGTTLSGPASAAGKQTAAPAAEADTQILAAGAKSGAIPPRGTGPAAGQAPVPKQRPAWLVAGGSAVLGLAVGIGIGYSLHGSSSSNSTATAAGTSTPNTAANGSAGASSSGGTATDTAGSPTATASAIGGVPTASGGTAATPGATDSATAGSTPSAGTTTSPATAPTTAPAPGVPTTPAPPVPTSAQQAESQLTDIVKQQVTNSTAASQLNGAIGSVAATKPGSGPYDNAIGKLGGLVTTELNQGQISSSTAAALRQQITYLRMFSGS